MRILPAAYKIGISKRFGRTDEIFGIEKPIKKAYMPKNNPARN